MKLDTGRIKLWDTYRKIEVDFQRIKKRLAELIEASSYYRVAEVSGITRSGLYRVLGGTATPENLGLVVYCQIQNYVNRADGYKRKNILPSVVWFSTAITDISAGNNTKVLSDVAKEAGLCPAYLQRFRNHQGGFSVIGAAAIYDALKLRGYRYEK